MSEQPVAEPRSVTFRKEREQTWNTLEDYITRSQKKGMLALDEYELQRFPILYRETLFSLSVARSTALDRSLILYLEALTSRAYLAVYGYRRPLNDLWKTFFIAVPRAVRQISSEIALSVGLFLLGMALAWVLTYQEPAWYYAFVPVSLSAKRTPWSSPEDLRKTLYSKGSYTDALMTFASHLFSHNTRIGILCFSLGFFLGIPTALLIFYNGLILGAFVATFHKNGLLFEVLGWLLPHGVPEIGAIILCGAAGFALGKALLFPGDLTRIDALRRAGSNAALVVAGCFVLFGVAAIVEGFFRQMVHNDMLRYMLAGINFLWLFGWLYFSGRKLSASEQVNLTVIGENFENLSSTSAS